MGCEDADIIMYMGPSTYHNMHMETQVWGRGWGYIWGVGILTTLRTWDPLADHPPQHAHRSMMIHMKESNLVILFSQNKEKLQE